MAHENFNLAHNFDMYKKSIQETNFFFFNEIRSSLIKDVKDKR